MNGSEVRASCLPWVARDWGTNDSRNSHDWGYRRISRKSWGKGGKEKKVRD